MLKSAAGAYLMVTIIYKYIFAVLEFCAFYWY